MKAALPDNEDRRIEALREYHILDTAADEAFDDLTQMAAYICQTPIAMISLVDTSRQWFKSKVGVETSETPRDVAFCAHTILDSRPLIVRDATKDPRFVDSALVTGEPGVRFYAGFPLTTQQGCSLGALCAVDRKPRMINFSQKQAMSRLARQVMALMNLRLTSEHLAQALENVKTLHELLPICAWCKRIRDDQGYWNQVEAYFKQHTGTNFTHGICPDCLKKMGPKPKTVESLG
jgi:GAF domain-containing protein